MRIVWVPISASSFEQTEIADYQAAHDPATPLDGLSLRAKPGAGPDLQDNSKGVRDFVQPRRIAEVARTLGTKLPATLNMRGS